MNVASLELCKELYELSGWAYEQYGYHKDGHVAMTMFDGRICPAYDLGYLLRKLHEALGVHELFTGVVKYLDPKTDEDFENAAAKLAIELFKQGILKRSKP